MSFSVILAHVIFPPFFSVDCTLDAVTRNCRNSLTPSRVRRDALPELEKQWQEIRQHATIEKDQEKLLRLVAEINKPQTDGLSKHNRK